MMRAIDHVGLTVADLDRAVEFWCDRLGLRLLHRATETGPDIAALIGEDRSS
jgi:catechol 2,3-dioxygenase-like lactoylglutathione lyase family enzyme